MRDTWFGNPKKVPLLLIALVVLGLFLTGCETTTEEEKEEESKAKITATTLTKDNWADGAITSGGEQWFRFTATAATQYLHVKFGTMDDTKVQLHTNTGNALGNATRLSGDSGDTKYTSWTVTSGQEYYVKVTSGDGWYSSTTGTYQIAFNAVPFRPGTFDQAATLFVNVWTNGTILEGEEKWYKFTATAATQYLHVSFGTMDDMKVQLHTNTGNALGNATRLTGDTRHTSWMVTSGQIYYVRVTSGDGWYSSTTGTYQIAFSTSDTPPQ